MHKKSILSFKFDLLVDIKTAFPKNGVVLKILAWKEDEKRAHTHINTQMKLMILKQCQFEQYDKQNGLESSKWDKYLLRLVQVFSKKIDSMMCSIQNKLFPNWFAF